jgi:CubicO group peptidase (beta-lactamase class C family)
MKNLLFLSLWVIVVTVITSCSNSYQRTQDFDGKDLVGSWEANFVDTEPSNEKFIFEFIQTEKGKLKGVIKTFQNGAKIMEMPIISIKYSEPELSLIAKSTVKIKYHGNISSDYNEIKGKLIFPDNNSQLMNLVKQESNNKEDKKTANISPRKASLDSNYLDGEKLKKTIKNIDSGKYGLVHSLLISRNNELVYEQYFDGYDRDKLHLISSNTKGIAAILIGQLIDKGYLMNEDEKLVDCFPEFKAIFEGDRQKITIRHLLTMTSGYKLHSSELYQTKNRLLEDLQRDLAYKPGEKFQYDPANANILAGIIKNKSGLHADEFAQKYLFEPLGIKSYNWEDEKQNGFPLMQGSLQLRPYDMIKIGLLLANDGKYEDRQIISKEWITKLKTASVRKDYSYLWWLGNSKVNSKELKGVIATGIGGQFIYVAPEKNLVIVTTAGNFHNNKTMDIVKMIEEDVLPVIK